MRLPDPARSRALLIGTGGYSDKRLPDIPVVNRTVTDLAALLTDSTYGVMPSANCVTLVDEGDMRQVGRQLQAAVAGAEDFLLVYFTGHGLVAGKRHDLYLGLQDSDWESPQFNSLDYDKVRAAVLDSRAKTKVIILDCCFSGRAVTDTMADPVAQVTNQLEVAGTYVLTSAQRDQVALVVAGEQHTAFTGRLMRILREGVPDGPELLTIEELYRQLASVMRSEGLSTPQKRGTVNAELVALGPNRALVAKALPILRRRQAQAIQCAENGDWPTATKLLEDLVEEQTRLLGAKHEDTLRSRQYLAHAQGWAGSLDEAAGDLRHLTYVQATVLGADHPDTLRSRQFYAVNLGESGDRSMAIRELRPLLSDRRRILGASDPDTLRTAHMLARNLARTGETREASALLREVIAQRERGLGTEHPHTVRAREDLAALSGGREPVPAAAPDSNA